MGVGRDNSALERPIDDVDLSAALSKLNDIIVESIDCDELSHAASEVLGQALGASRVGYSAIDATSDTLHTSKDWCAPGVASLAGVLNLRDYGSFIDSLKRGEFIAITDVRHDQRTAVAAPRSSMQVPAPSSTFPWSSAASCEPCSM